jgi:hypothetical protein
MTTTTHARPLLVLVLAAITVSGCQSIYYDTMEKFGQHKRDILVRRVDDARQSQEEAKEQFQTALEEFMEVTGFTGGNLRRQYDRFEAAFSRSETRAAASTSLSDPCVRPKPGWNRSSTPSVTGSFS